jgi:hypothetical protein
MLEQQGLLLGPWRQAAATDKMNRPPAAPGERLRDVFDLATKQHLGFTRARTGAAWPGFRWLARRMLEVFETEDASLLCTATRSWGLAWGWEVCDADERRVATVYRRLILRNTGRALAMAQRPKGPAPGRFLNPQGTELGTFTITPEGLSLTFAPVLEGDPFARMALLGAVLSYDW